MHAPETTIHTVGADPSELLALRYEWLECASRDEAFEVQFRAWWQTERHHRHALVAATASRPVGMANALVYSRMPSPGRPQARWLYAANVYVTPTFRQRGVATSLMTQLIEDARRQGMERIVLAPSVMSIPMYRCLGFRVADDLLRLDL